MSGRSTAATVLLALGLAACTTERDPAAPPPASSAVPVPSPSRSGQAGTADIMAAAEAFLGTLEGGERDDVLFDRDDREQRQRWSNLPHQVFDRRGLMIGDLDQAEVDAFLTVMRATLSTEGFDRVMAQWAADDALAAADGRANLGRPNYWVAIIGEPSATEGWQWQFGGHHVTVNATISGDSVSLTPSFLGVQPATYESGGRTVRPLGDIIDQAFTLVGSLQGGARQRAVLGDTPIDLELGAGQDCRSIAPVGLPGSAMNAAQRAAFLDLIGEYGGLGAERFAAGRLAQLEAELPDTWFAWHGPTTPGSAAYFRVTGPHVVIEYSPQAMGGDPAEHIHGVYRDPVNDYGGTVC
ncbi:DUF3500 domain-containing protein [Actinoplanes sp. LDG1-06]|uniref:DUF3500 domain-containing protein n=1 Tax=Paractinoplanes ovalisporus TaxID=2810368 RepID=A0ABS2AK21_9ACTN|nr:DUF3500 domain-containing protein [Actinoplanes ovalisporus]MBM2619718.1 DUF3500 domain-containing protein [Actinoplanes ovalisporus]